MRVLRQLRVYDGELLHELSFLVVTPQCQAAAAVVAAAVLSGCDCAGTSAGPDAGEAECYEPAVCYEGPADTMGVGTCRSGLRPCVDGRLAECEDQVLPAPESCNGLDDDCDGVADNETCNFACVGVGCERGWGELPEGLDVGPAGGLVLTSPESSEIAVLWVLERNTGTVAKVDTRLRQVVARYSVVPPDYCDVQELPRAVVTDPAGDAYISTFSYGAGRGRVLSIIHEGCPDADGDGVVETSSGPDDVRAFLEDECVRWHFVAGEDEMKLVLAFETSARRAGADSLLWISNALTRRVWAVDPATGEETGDELYLDPTPWGQMAAECMAFDGLGHLHAGAFNSLDVIDTGDLDYDRFPYPTPNGQRMVQDHRGRVWETGLLKSYDVAEGEWIVPSIYERWGGMYIEGPVVGAMVVASTGVLYGQALTGLDGEGLDGDRLLTYDIDEDEFEIDMDTHLDSPSLVLDRDGMIWQLLRPQARCGGDVCCELVDERVDTFVIDPWTGEREVAMEGQLGGASQVWENPTGVSPKAIRMDPRSTTYTFEGCDPEDPGETEWLWLEWEAALPAGTSISFDVEATASATPSGRGWIAAATAPPDASPVFLGDVLTAQERYLHVRLTLSAVPDAPPGERVTPELLWVGARWGCHGAAE